MARRLRESEIGYVVRQHKKGTPTSTTTSGMKISRRRVQQLLAEFRATVAIPVLQRPGRPRIKLNQDRTDSVLKACEEIPAGVQRITRILRKQGTQIRYDAVYRVMKDGGYVVPSAAKSKRRKWVRYERKYSNAMWHTDQK